MSRKIKKAAIALSGGVDSATAAAILKEQGFECVGMHLRFWTDPSAREEDYLLPQNKCCTLDGLEDARRVCAELKMPFYVINAAGLFKKNVVDYFLDSYGGGETPNPCVECNRTIKFGILLRRAKELGADFLATGHYVRKVTNGRHELWMAEDKTKDQSYFLYRLDQRKLENSLFPLGGFEKSYVRKLAAKYGLARVEQKQESQGICFYPEAKPEEFLRRHLKKNLFAKGPIETVDGKIIGEHKGLPLYTIGQRKGIGIGGISGPKSEPLFVCGFERKRNALIVGKKEDAFKKEVYVAGATFIAGDPIPNGKDIFVRIRYRSLPQKASVASIQADTGANGGGYSLKLRFEKPVFAVSPGQSAVFYDGEKVLGGGKII